VGYTTDFDGHINLEPALKPEQIAYINAFSGSRRMKRNAEKVEKLSDPLRAAVGLPVGRDGEYYVGGGQHGYNESSVLDSNGPPAKQPGLWCQWVVSEDGKRLEWDGGEKFYEYIKWMEYMVKHFFNPWNILMNGSIAWQGEERDDFGTVEVVDNVVGVGVGHCMAMDEEEDE
jgi:hypothetical protein